METQRPGTLPKRLRTRCRSIAILFGILLIAGNVWFFLHMQRMFLDDVRARGLALVQQHVSVAAHSLGRNNGDLLMQTSDLLLTQQGVRYLVITNADNHPLFSKSAFSNDNFTLPEEFRYLPCSNGNLSAKNNLLFGEAILRVDADIRSGSQPTDCIGAMSLGLSLKDPTRRLWHLLAISIGCSVILFGGILASITIFLRQTADLMQRIAHALLTAIPENFRERQSSTSTRQDDTIAEHAARQLTVYLSQERERMHLTNSQMHQAVDDLTKMVDAHTGYGNQYASLTQEYSMAATEGLKKCLQQASDAQQMNATAAAALLSMQAIDSSVERFAVGLDEMQNSVESNMERVKTLNDKIREIRHAVKTITSIADLTKLIAFNASIEAAGAGKSGGRFSIVATEVRRLANTVVNSVEEIGALVSAIETAAADLQLSSETELHKANNEHALMIELRGLLQHTSTLLRQTAGSAQNLVSSSQNQEERERLNADIQTLAQDAEHIARDHIRLSDAVKKLAELVAEGDTAILSIS